MQAAEGGDGDAEETASSMHGYGVLLRQKLQIQSLLIFYSCEETLL